MSTAGVGDLDPRPVTPLGAPLDAVVRLPGSKSITNRALLAAALGEGVSRLKFALLAEDTLAMADCLARLGAGITAEPEYGIFMVDGLAGSLPDGEFDLDAGQSGTTARFLLPVLAVGPGTYRLDGHPQLRARPMNPGIEAARALGATVEELGQPGRLPVLIRGSGGAFDVHQVRVGGDVSSQFLSGLMLAGPLLPNGLEIEITGELVSLPYVLMTARVMVEFSATVSRPAENRLVVRHRTYRGDSYDIEPDASAASYFLAAAAICGGRVRVPDLNDDSIQGDIWFADLLERMGAEVRWAMEGVTVTGPPDVSDLVGIEADLTDMSDLAPTLGVVAAVARTPTRVSGVGFIRRKESDRVAVIVRELRRCGVDAEEEDDGFVVRPGPLRPAVVQPEGDHRIGMAFAVLGLRVPGIAIADPGCVAKTFPGFWDTLDRLGRPAEGSG